MTTWLNLTAVALGGAVGSVARYLITVVSVSIPGGSTMLGTTIANVVGCAAIGAFVEYTVAEGYVSERIQLAIRVGLLGGLTTFSTFSFESVALAEGGRWSASGLYVASNLMLGWVALVAAAAIVKGWMA
jgi:fluoride exporter